MKDLYNHLSTFLEEICSIVWSKDPCKHTTLHSAEVILTYCDVYWSAQLFRSFILLLYCGSPSSSLTVVVVTHAGFDTWAIVFCMTQLIISYDNFIYRSKMTTWSLQIILITFEVLIHLSNAFIIVEHDDGSQSDCNQTHPCTNLQSALPEMKSGSKMIIGAGDKYTLSNDEDMKINSIVIVGEGSDNTVITCDSYAGLAFTNVHNITIANLTLKECGACRNSTTKNDTNNFTYKFRCSLYFLNCSDVTIYDVIVTDSPGTGVMMYDVLGTVIIEQSQFIRNRVPIADEDTIPGGGGVYIEFTYCLPNTTNFNTCSPTNQSNAKYIIDNCRFINNTGTTIKEASTAYIFPIGPCHQQFGRGGGLSMHFKGNAINNNITITNCTIEHNMAVWGGGMLVDLLDLAQSNHIVIKDVIFANNSIPIKTGTGGGALRINYFPQVESAANIVNVTECKFDGNSAYFGGAISVSPKQEKGATNCNRINFTRCVWQNNRAHIGSAIDLSSYFDEPGSLFAFAVFKNCSFIGNGHMQISDTELHIGMGSFHSDGISFSFEDDNYFIENNETALMVTQATVEFEEFATAEFVDNKGYRGGAMALLGNTWLNMHPNTTVLFTGNLAYDKGGAVYYVSAGVRDVNSRKCFIRYFDYQIFPNMWNTSFIFINNTSRNPGHAIYCTTLVTCSWNDTSINTSPEVLKTTFRWENAFTYDDYHDDTIATDPATAKINMEKFHSIPGKLRYLNVSVSDDLGIPRKTVFFVRSDNESAGNLASTSTYISDNQIEVLGSPGESFLLHFYTVTTRVLSFTINITLAECPPGYYFPTDTANPSHGKCICSVYDKNQRYDHVPYCEVATFQAVLQPQFWAGYPQGGNVLVTGKCPSGYCHTNKTKKLLLPPEANSDQLNELICSPNNRTGTLCGRCKNGYHIYANAKPYYKCGKCSGKNGYVLQIFSKYIPLILFLLTIILLDINLASGLLNTFVFFSQMLPSLDLYAGGEIPINHAAKPFVLIYQFCYGIFNLQYFESLDIFQGWCTFGFPSALTVVAFGYMEAVVPLVIIFVVWLIIFASDYCTCGNEIYVVRCINIKLRQLYKRIKPNGISLSKSFFRGLVTFILLSYTKFTLVTLTLLAPAYLSGPGGRNYSSVAKLDGTLEYFGHEHLHYAIPAILVLIFIVLLPLVLFATYPWMCSHLGIRTNRMMHFFDPLYGAFKVEHKLYYFSLLYFVYRIALVAIFTFTPEVQQRYTLQQVFTSIVFMLHVIARPYREEKHNMADLCLLALIPTVISISFFQLFRVTNSDNVNQFAMAVQIILLYIPLIYLIGVIVHKLYQWKRHNGYEQIDDNVNNILAAGNDQSIELCASVYQH